MQFATMLVLVRLLSPNDYGRMALAQTIIAFISVLSFKTFAPHALQSRNPEAVDWQAYFALGSVLNAFAFLVSLVIGALLSLTTKYSAASLPLTLLAMVFLLEVPANLRQTMAQVTHDWVRTRGLIVAGSALSNVVAIAIALAGGGILALVIGPVLNVVPATLDLFLIAKWRPAWDWNWQRCRDAVAFGIKRVASAGVLSGRQAVEQSMLAGTYSFSTLGLFSRSIGLATLVGGRIGGLASLSLYSVITRAECRSERFRRLAGLMLRGVAWITIPCSVFLALSANDITTLIYGHRWVGVIPLVPFAAGQAALSGITWAAETLLLANDEVRACLAVDLATAAIGAAVVLWLVPSGPRVYLVGSAAMYVIILGLVIWFLNRTKGIGLREAGAAFLPPLVSCLVAAAALLGAKPILPRAELLLLRLSLEGTVFFVVFAITMRTAFPVLLREFLDVVPGGRRTALVLRLADGVTLESNVVEILRQS
jgi:O-antigen/teichoic acid export membrane protein